MEHCHRFSSPEPEPQHYWSSCSLCTNIRTVYLFNSSCFFNWIGFKCRVSHPVASRVCVCVYIHAVCFTEPLVWDFILGKRLASVFHVLWILFFHHVLPWLTCLIIRTGSRSAVSCALWFFFLHQCKGCSCHSWVTFSNIPHTYWHATSWFASLC